MKLLTIVDAIPEIAQKVAGDLSATLSILDHDGIRMTSSRLKAFVVSEWFS